MVYGAELRRLPIQMIAPILATGSLLSCALNQRSNQAILGQAKAMVRACYPGLGPAVEAEVIQTEAAGDTAQLHLRYSSGHAFSVELARAAQGLFALDAEPRLYESQPQPKRPPHEVGQSLGRVVFPSRQVLVTGGNRVVRSPFGGHPVLRVRVRTYLDGLPVRLGEGAAIEFHPKTLNVISLRGQTRNEPFGNKTEKIGTEDLLSVYTAELAKARAEHEERARRFRGSPRYQETLRSHWTYGGRGSTKPDFAARCWSTDYLATEPALPGLRRAWMVRSPAGIAVLDAETGKLLQFDTEDRDLLPDLKKSPFIDVHKEAAKKG